MYFYILTLFISPIYTYADFHTSKGQVTTSNSIDAKFEGEAGLRL